MKKSYILFFLVSFSFSVTAQIQWQHSFGGTANDQAKSINQTSDGGYVIAGLSESNNGDVTGNHGLKDYWVVKLNSSGTLEWQKSLGGSNNDIGYSIIQTYDSGYAIAGQSPSNNGDVTGNHGGNDCWIIKLNASGIIQWQRSLGGTSGDYAYSIIQSHDSGYVVAGNSFSNNGDVISNYGDIDYWVVKLNSSGTIQWQKSLGGTSADYARSIIQTSDSGYVIAGYSQSNDSDVTGNHGLKDYWVVKLNSSGTLEWQKSLGGTDNDLGYSIIQTYDSGYAIAGESYSNNGDVTGNHGSNDFWVVKLNASGTEEWQKSLGGTGFDVANSIIQATDSGYIVAGTSNSNDGDVTGNHGGNDYWVVKLNGAGTLEWQKSFGGTSQDWAYSIIQTSNSGYAVAGQSASNNGDVTGNYGLTDYWVVKLGMTTRVENLFNSNTLPVYPNPSTNNFSIPANSEFDNAQLNVFNAMGCNVYSCRLNRETKVIDAGKFSSGIYYVQIIKGEKMWGRKLLKSNNITCKFVRETGERITFRLTQFLKMGHWVQVQTLVFQTKDIPCTNSGVSNSPFLKTALIPVDVPLSATLWRQCKH